MKIVIPRMTFRLELLIVAAVLVMVLFVTTTGGCITCGASTVLKDLGKLFNMDENERTEVKRKYIKAVLQDDARHIGEDDVMQQNMFYFKGTSLSPECCQSCNSTSVEYERVSEEQSKYMNSRGGNAGR